MASIYFFVAVAHVICTALLLTSIRVFLLPAFITSCFSTGVDIIVCLLIARTLFPFTKSILFGHKVQPYGKPVLITGCDHGFGHMLAKQLDSKGFRVFAGCLDPSAVGAEELRKYCSKRLEILKLDVRKDENVNEAVNFVKDSLGYSDLWAIVNNAGILRGISVEFSDHQDFEDCMDVNLFGTVRVTKAFLPLLKRSRGRIVNVTSLGGKLTIPYLAPYIVSKFAAVGFSECLRQELSAWGIRVISVEPELFRTPIADWNVTEKRLDGAFDSLPVDVKESYGDDFFKKFKKLAKQYTLSTSTKVENVVRDLELAVSLEHPDAVYRPCRNFIAYASIYCYERMPIVARDFLIKCLLRSSKINYARKSR